MIVLERRASHILLEGKAPPNTLLIKLSISSFAMLALGSTVFRWMKRGFYDHL